MQWFVVTREGDERELVPEADIRHRARYVPIFGAMNDKRAVVYDRILAARGVGPYRVTDLTDYSQTVRAG